MTPNRNRKSARRRVPVAVALATAALLGSACGGGGDKSAAASSATTTSTEATSSTTPPDPTTTTAAPTTTTTTARPTPTTAAKAAAMAIDIRTFAFQPNPVHVAVGTTVTWTNQDEILHTVTSGMRIYDDQRLQKEIVPGPPGFDFQLDGKGKTATFTFSQAGTFSYLCSRHPGMDAQIVVG